MKNQNFKKTLIFSLLSHITVFSIFSLSFGSRFPNTNLIPVNFWGQMGKIELGKPPYTAIKGIKEIFMKLPDMPKPQIASQEAGLLADYHLKPALPLSFNKEKEIYFKKSGAFPYPLRKKEPVIIFHPFLPHNFSLYFKDRQVAHVELMFNIVPKDEYSSILIKRKITSANLEVDLLSMRYIGHYLFIQQANFTPNFWQTVKIDLSAKND